MYMFTHKHICIYIYTHTYIYIYTHIHTMRCQDCFRIYIYQYI